MEANRDFSNVLFSGHSLRILAGIKTSNYSIVHNLSNIDSHLSRLETLSNQTASLSQYVSISISLMISQIRAIQHYANGSSEACLSELKKAAEREVLLVPDNNSPYLIFIRSSELLALHLLLIHKDKQTARVSINLNRTALKVTERVSTNTCCVVTER
jgi:hypothetical protein